MWLPEKQYVVLNDDNDNELYLFDHKNVHKIFYFFPYFNNNSGQGDFH